MVHENQQLQQLRAQAVGVFSSPPALGSLVEFVGTDAAHRHPVMRRTSFHGTARQQRPSVADGSGAILPCGEPRVDSPDPAHANHVRVYLPEGCRLDVVFQCECRS